MDFLSMLQGGINPQNGGRMDIQGRTNPGAIPLQNSGRGGKGYAANLQPTKNPQAQQLQMAPAQRPQPAMGKGALPMSRDNQITNQMVTQGYLPPEQAEIYPQMPPMTPWQQMPRHQRPQGFPQNFRDAPQLPVHDPELYDEVLRTGRWGTRTPAQDPLAVLRSLLGL